MFKFQAIAQMGIQFSGNLFMNDSLIGGVGYDKNGLYVNLRNELSIKEMVALMEYISTFNDTFFDKNIHINYIEVTE